MPPRGLSIFAIHSFVRKSGRIAYWLVSVIALLGFACFPALAEADSSSIQYEESVPTATGKSTIPSHSGPAHASTASGGGGSATSQPGSTAPGSGGSASAGAPTTRTGNGDSAHRRRRNGAGVGVADHLRAAGQSDRSAQTSSDGGSSPLVPILIAIAALAAISIAAVIVRQRRQRRSPGPEGDAVQAKVTEGAQRESFSEFGR